MMLHLNQVGIITKKHILDDKVYNAMKIIIRDKYKMKLELEPPCCYCCNAAEVAIRKFKAHFLSVLGGTATSFPPTLWG